MIRQEFLAGRQMLKGSVEPFKEAELLYTMSSEPTQETYVTGRPNRIRLHVQNFFFFQLTSKITKAIAIAIGCWRLIPVSEDPAYLGHKNQMTRADLIWTCSICSLAFTVLESTIGAGEGGKQSIVLSNCAVSECAIQMPSVWGLTRPDWAIQITVLKSKCEMEVIRK